MFKRSQSVCLQIPFGGDWTPSVVSPMPSLAPVEPGFPKSFPDFQRVTISGDYCAGVNTLTHTDTLILLRITTKQSEMCNPAF